MVKINDIEDTWPSYREHNSHGRIAAATGEIEFDALEESLRERFPGALADKISQI